MKLVMRAPVVVYQRSLAILGTMQKQKVQFLALIVLLVSMLQVVVVPLNAMNVLLVIFVLAVLPIKLHVHLENMRLFQNQ